MAVSTKTIKRLFLAGKVISSAALGYFLFIVISCVYIIYDVSSPGSFYQDTPSKQYPLKFEAGFDTSYSFSYDYRGHESSAVSINAVFSGNPYFGEHPEPVHIPINWKLFCYDTLILEDTNMADFYYPMILDSGKVTAFIGQFDILPKTQYRLEIQSGQTIDNLNQANPTLSLERSGDIITAVWIAQFLHLTLRENLLKAFIAGLVLITLVIAKRRYSGRHVQNNSPPAGS